MNKPLQATVQASVPQKNLHVVVVQSEQIHDTVAECAAELSSVNSTLEQELSSAPAQPALEVALEHSQAVEAKVQVCADDLTQVNQALKGEVKERHLLEQELDAAQEDAAATRLASLHDPLTSLPNRSLFNDRLKHGLAQARRHGWTLAVMFIDLNGFKSINDSYGHTAGDLVLKTVASRLRSMTREDDTVSRHGGDEFVYLLMELRQESDAARIAEKIIARVGEPFELETEAEPIEVSVKCSVGISIFPRNGSTDTLLIASADKAMYRAKRAGGGYAFDLDALEQ